MASKTEFRGAPGGHPGGPGRPPVLGEVTERYQVRCTPEEKALWKYLAERERLDLTHFARQIMRIGHRGERPPRHLIDAARASARAGTPVSARFPIRCTPEERERWQSRAARSLISISHYTRMSLRERTGLAE